MPGFCSTLDPVISFKTNMYPYANFNSHCNAKSIIRNVRYTLDIQDKLLYIAGTENCSI